MFQKKLAVATQSVLSGKDVKTLRKDVAKLYPLSDEELSALLPPKAGITLAKLSNSRCLVYSTEGGNPLFFDPEGRGKLLPTVYTLAQFPGLLPHLHTWSEVSPKVLGGADLFLQGVLPPSEGAELPQFLAGTAMALCARGNPLPFAVGTMAVSRAEADREGFKGRGLAVLHSYGDLLWGLGDKAPPNAGFTPARIFPVEEDAAGPAAEELGGLQLGGDDGAADGAMGEAAEGCEAGGTEEAATEEPAGPAGLDMDAMLEHAVLAGLHSLTTAELPIQSSDFYTKHMLPAKPAGVVFDMKASKYKKLGKLLDHFEKGKALTQKVIRKQDHIAAVDRSSHLYISFDPATAPDAGAAAAGPSNGGGSSGGGGGGGGKVEITYCYRAPSSLRPLFGAAAEGDKDRLYREEEVGAALAAYTAAEGLQREGGAVALDRRLHGALFNKKEEAAPGTTVPAAPLRRRLLERLQMYHRLVRPGQGGAPGSEVTRKGPLKQIAVAAERRHGRNVTSVQRLEGFAFDAADAAADFQRRFKTSCTVSKLPGNAEKDSEILMQGDLARAVAEHLERHCGVPRDYIDLKAGAAKK